MQFKRKNDLTGTTLGQYRIVQHIGRGGMADVYKAEHVGLSVFRIIKVVRPEFMANKEFGARFKTEAQAVAMLRHNNIVQLQDFCFENDMFYMVMEFVDGQNLMECIEEEGPMRPVERAVRLVSQIAAALHYAHTQGLIHRDIKPQNILLDSSGVPILTDFGIAKLLESNSELTREGSSIGTPNYMAPEQAKGSGAIGPTADVYSLAVVLYEILTGVVPFEAPTPVATLMKAMHEPVPPPQQYYAAISDELQAVILKGMAKSPRDRYLTAQLFQRALDNTLRTDAQHSLPEKRPSKRSHGSIGKSRSTRGRNTRGNQRRRSRVKTAPVLAGAVGLIALCGVAAGLWFANKQSPAAGDQTVQATTDSGRIVREGGSSGRDGRIGQDGGVQPNSGQSSAAAADNSTATTTQLAGGKVGQAAADAAAAPRIIQGGSIKLDAYIERLIEHPGQEVRYTFFGAEGQSVYFDSRHNSRNVTNYTLLAPDNKVKVFASDVDAGPWELPQTGAYTLVVDPLIERPVYVEFVLWYLDPPVVEQGELALNTVIESSIARPGQKAEYTFAGEKGQSVYFESKQDARFEINYRLTAPDKKTVVFDSKASTGRLELPQTGTYALLVDPQNTFGFKFLLRRE